MKCMQVLTRLAAAAIALALTTGLAAAKDLRFPDKGDVAAYFKAVGAATSLPMMMQAVGDVSVELVADVARQVPTLVAVKDEAGDPIARALTELRAGILA